MIAAIDIEAELDMPPSRYRGRIRWFVLRNLVPGTGMRLTWSYLSGSSQIDDLVKTNIDGMEGVGIAMGWTTRVRFSAGQEFLLLHVVQTGSGAHTVSYPVCTGVSFPGGKVARA
jgi:hypothetical protein